MQYINRIDEKGRFIELKAYINDKSSQTDSHTYSYLYGRQMRQEMGMVMGLEKEVLKYDIHKS